MKIFDSMKRLFLTAMAVFAVSAMFVSCNKQGGESSEDDGVKYALFFNYGQSSDRGSDTQVLNDILDKAKELTVAADIALYGGSKTEYPFNKELSAKTEKAAKAEYDKLVDKAKEEGNKIVTELKKIATDKASEIADYPKDKYVKLDFSFMLLKYTPDMIGGEIVVETDCGKFEVAGSK